MNRSHTIAPTNLCIYCQTDAPRTTREHVMPQALGTFEHNWTLDSVCDDCNHFFSRELELALGRDSAEAFLRIDCGVKPPASAEKLLTKRMVATLKAPGHFEGARVVMKPTEENDGILPVPPPQVGFRRAGENWRYILERELNDESIRELGTGPFEVKVIGRGDDLQRLSAKLRSLGFDFVVTDHVRDQPISDANRVFVEYEFFVDRTLRRAAAKIGFNYAAKVLGAAVMQRQDFDAIRRFVRFGEEPQMIVSAQRISILVGSEAARSKTHACGLGWLSETRSLIGLVSLFNEVTYGIRMCHSETDEWANVSFQHLFDPVSRQITNLVRAS